jgi:hypothetical protein
LHKRAEKIAALLQERGKVNAGDHVGEFFLHSNCQNFPLQMSKSIKNFSSNLPSRPGSNLRLLRLSLPRRRASHNPPSPSPEPNHHPTNGPHDR